MNKKNQIYLFEKKINKMKKHFKLHKKDFSGMRGLKKKINNKKKYLNYIFIKKKKLKKKFKFYLLNKI
ncbi:30S ribosomal protein S15 [Candidatus Vidania fulgoroideorum]